MDLVKNISVDEKFTFTGKAKSKIILLIAVGLVLAVLGFILMKIDPPHGAHADHAAVAEKTVEHAEVAVAAEHAEGGHHGNSPLIKRIIKDVWQNNVFFGGIALISVFFLAFNYVAYSGWWVSFKRVPEAMGYYLPVYAIFSIALIALFGHDIFHWMDASLLDPNSPHFDEILSQKTWWLSPGKFWFRIIVYFVLWILFWYVLRQKSVKEDLEGGVKLYDKSIIWAAGFLVVFGVTSSTSAWDLVMSMDPHFFSTMFGWYVFASWLVSGVAMITLIVIVLKENGYLKIVNENHLHDLGKYMFAFSIFWTYVWFEQFLLIYYANIPEESYYFVERLLNGTYRPFFFMTFFINFVFPFIVLMTRNAKRQFTILKIAAVAILIGHWFDFYMMMTPAMLHNDGAFDYKFYFIELGITMTFLGIFLYAVLFGLSKAGLIAKNDPMLEESIHHHVY